MATTLISRNETLNGLLRTELAAIETYHLALRKVRRQPCAAELHALETEHRSAAEALRQSVRRRAGRPARSSGAWGTWARIVEGTAQLFGNVAALRALRDGEVRCIAHYEGALAGEDIDQPARTLIASELLPAARARLTTLDRLIEQGACPDSGEQP
jgi:hypothetical protein